MLSFILQRPVIDPCTTLPVTGYVIQAVVIYINGSVRFYMSNFINDTSERVSVSYNESFNETLEPNVKYVFTINSTNAQIPPQSPPGEYYNNM